jgi:hypothetical protein
MLKLTSTTLLILLQLAADQLKDVQLDPRREPFRIELDRLLSYAL